MAIEVKRGRRVARGDVAGLRSFSSDYPAARLLLLYGGDRRLTVDGIDVMPVDEGLSRLPQILQGKNR